MYDRKEAIRDIEMTKEFLQAKHESWYADLLSEALDLLKEQEPVKPVLDEYMLFYKCGACGRLLSHNILKLDNFCWNCGRKVKWNKLNEGANE